MSFTAKGNFKLGSMQANGDNLRAIKYTGDGPELAKDAAKEAAMVLIKGMGLLHEVVVELSGHNTDNDGADYIMVKVSRATLAAKPVDDYAKYQYVKPEMK